MKSVLVIGSGAREHALAWKLSQSKRVNNLFVAPGNPGTAAIAQNVSVAATDVGELVKFAQKNTIDLTVVGSDEPLARGIVDEFQLSGLKIFGPTKQAAKIEWSKVYAKKFMKKHGLPTANYAVFQDQVSALTHLKNIEYPTVIKVDGLALGKGVFICQNNVEAKLALTIIFADQRFGDSGQKVVIEEFLTGEEVSAHAICDGKNFVMFPLAQDHKRLGVDDSGPNTGGMGTVAPLTINHEPIRKIIAQTLTALKSEGVEFRGCLFPGIMLTQTGPKILEYNARFGDPETQVYLRLLETDLFELLEAGVNQTLGQSKLRWQRGAAACVVLASKGYPEKSPTGFEITGLETIQNRHIKIFQAGTKENQRRLFTAGGRVLSVTATGEKLEEAVDQAYQAVEQINFEGKTYRPDIGYRMLIRSR